MKTKLIFTTATLMITASAFGGDAWSSVREAGAGLICSEANTLGLVTSQINDQIKHAAGSRQVKASQPTLAVSPEGKFIVCVSISKSSS